MVAVAAVPALGAAAVVAGAGSADAYTNNGDGTVTVQSGDTVSEISVGVGVRTQDTLSNNGLGWETLIFPGQTLRLPTGASTAAPSAPVPAHVAAPAASTAGEEVVAQARKYLGVAYVYGGSTPAGFDCSGLTSYVYAKFGTTLPRVSTAQRSSGVRVTDPQPGDLVTFNSLHHVAIYAGNGRIIDAPHPGAVVRERALWTTDVTYRRVV